ncbi:MAG: nucleotidyltransferase domain-containing protein [Phycisphaerae bacterium]|nr:nucleotidyltransferase domain-containing protein [Phycisphaerae bacterium]
MISSETLLKVKERLVDGFHPDRIILFGSHARGTADDRSDVDILVICSFKGKRRHLMLEMDRALRGLNLARDIVILTPEEYERNRHIPGTIARPAWKEGKVLYENARSTGTG